MPAPTFSDRRRFLSRCTATLMTVITGAIVAPVVAFVISPLWRGKAAGAAGDDFSDAGPLDAVPTGTWTLLPIEIVRQNGWDKSQQSRSVWVLVSGKSQADVKVLSPICPHLGCPITYSAAKSDFLCPCHGSIFNDAGGFVSGPSPRAMDSIEFQVRDGHLWVRWQDFRTGLNEKVAVEV